MGRGLALALLLAPGAAIAAEPLARLEDCFSGAVCVQEDQYEDEIAFSVKNLTDQPITTDLALQASGNLGPTQHLVERLKPGEVEELERIRAPRSGFVHYWRFYWHFGTAFTRHSSRTIYRLPYERGKSFEVRDDLHYDPDAKFGPTAVQFPGPYDRDTISFDMPVGTNVVAARAGEVVWVWDGYEAGGDDPDLERRDNLIVIRHKDGTYAHYVHLLADSALVAPGDKVEAGDLIARSGQSGYVTEPALLFYVSAPQNKAEAFQTFPVRFQTSRNRTQTLEVGRRYRAP